MKNETLRYTMKRIAHDRWPAPEIKANLEGNAALDPAPHRLECPLGLLAPPSAN
mgnify:CR=1 FL=1